MRWMIAFLFPAVLMAETNVGGIITHRNLFLVTAQHRVKSGLFVGANWLRTSEETEHEREKTISESFGWPSVGWRFEKKGEHEHVPLKVYLGGGPLFSRHGIAGFAGEAATEYEWGKSALGSNLRFLPLRNGELLVFGEPGLEYIRHLKGPFYWGGENDFRCFKGVCETGVGPEIQYWGRTRHVDFKTGFTLLGVKTFSEEPKTGYEARVFFSFMW